MRPFVCSTFDLQVSSVQETQRHSSESDQIRILLERQKEQILADCRAEIQTHEFHADYDRRKISKNRELLESHEKSLNEMEELKRFQGFAFDTIARRRLIEVRDAILDLTAKIQELQNEVNCMSDFERF